MRYESSAFGGLPDALYVDVPGLTTTLAYELSAMATILARNNFPKLSTMTSQSLTPFAGEGFFGVQWSSPIVWLQEAGTKPRTMRSLAGKTIPMWIDDPSGEMHRQNPKAPTRVTLSGRRQVLIFRRAARSGQRRSDGSMASYPGAPGRIALREAARPLTTSGRVGGRIAAGNVGVRWRHPGLSARGVVRNAVEVVANRAGIKAVIKIRNLGR